jgi:transposase-like protein
MSKASTKKPLTQWQITDYITHDGAFCPYCESNQISGGSIDVEGAAAWQEITCNDCGKAWTDEFKLVSITEQR